MTNWIPACAGMTGVIFCKLLHSISTLSSNDGELNRISHRMQRIEK